ncbi:MAG: RDD family protein [Candidatus Solibacter sp.]
MTCGYCGTRNGDGEHRCTRCGRRPEDTPSGGYGVNGALAEQLNPVPRPQLVERAPRPEVQETPSLSQAFQASLFPASNVIAMPPRPEAKPRTRAEGPVKPAAPRTAARRAKPVPEGQGTLDFLPPAPAKPRQLGTSVEAVIYCEAPVATTLHRAVACTLDWAMVILGYAVFLGVFSGLGGTFELTRSNLMIYGAMFLLVGFTYGMLFAWAGAETPGMLWSQQKLTTFDGFPPDRRQRLVRFIASSLSRCTMLGLLWSLADEESLAWHDHISRTFPTPRDSRTLVFRDE